MYLWPNSVEPYTDCTVLSALEQIHCTFMCFYCINAQCIILEFPSLPNRGQDWRIFNVWMWSFCMCMVIGNGIHMAMGPLVYSLFWRTLVIVESAQNLTLENLQGSSLAHNHNGHSFMCLTWILRVSVITVSVSLCTAVSPIIVSP